MLIDSYNSLCRLVFLYPFYIGFDWPVELVEAEKTPPKYRIQFWDPFDVLRTAYLACVLILTVY